MQYFPDKDMWDKNGIIQAFRSFFDHVYSTFGIFTSVWVFATICNMRLLACLGSALCVVQLLETPGLGMRSHKKSSQLWSEGETHLLLKITEDLDINCFLDGRRWLLERKVNDVM